MVQKVIRLTCFTSFRLNILSTFLFYYHYYIQWSMFRCFKHNHHETMNGRLYTRGCIFHLDELSSVVRLERRTTVSLGRIMRLVTSLY